MSGFFCLFLPGAALLAGCRGADPDGKSTPPETARVVLYTSVDEPFAQQIIERFTAASGVKVDAAFDTEAGKTSGFLRRIRREADAQRCDVWWSSEAFGTVELANEGLFAAYESPAAADIPVEWKDPQHCWAGHAARPRVLAYNPQHVHAQDLPKTWLACGDTKWKGRLALANPQFGTTRGHVAALFRYCGKDAAGGLLTALAKNQARIADGNAQAARMVAQGAADLAWTDLDDVVAMQRQNLPIGYSIPRVSDDLEALWIPCTVALVKGGPHADAGRKLIDFLLSPEVERALAQSDSRNVPVRATLREELKIDLPAPAAADFEGITRALPGAMDAARDALLH